MILSSLLFTSLMGRFEVVLVLNVKMLEIIPSMALAHH